MLAGHARLVGVKTTCVEHESAEDICILCNDILCWARDRIVNILLYKNVRFEIIWRCDDKNPLTYLNVDSRVFKNDILYANWGGWQEERITTVPV